MTALTGYGVEAWCLGSLVTGRYARGNNVVAQAIYRRLTTPRGTLRGGEEESNYGIDLSDYVGAVADTTRLAAIPGVAKGEILKDDRVLDVTVDASYARDAAGLVTVTLNLLVTLASDGSTFSMTLAASAAGVALTSGVP